MYIIICRSSLESVHGGLGFLAGILPNIWPTGGAFTRALKFEKLKAPLFPRGAGGTDDWCIRH